MLESTHCVDLRDGECCDRPLRWTKCHAARSARVGSGNDDGSRNDGPPWNVGQCNPRSAGLAEWRIERIESMVRPTDAQRPKLDEPKAASVKRAEIISAACPREIPQSPVARLDLMEKRINAMLESIKLVRPKFAAFYDSLTSEQQSRFSSIGPRRWGWRGWRSQQ